MLVKVSNKMEEGTVVKIDGGELTVELANGGGQERCRESDLRAAPLRSHDVVKTTLTTSASGSYAVGLHHVEHKDGRKSIFVSVDADGPNHGMVRVGDELRSVAGVTGDHAAMIAQLMKSKGQRVPVEVLRRKAPPPTARTCSPAAA